jgi:hypothetical protein
MSILIVGSEGSMGKRYQAILEYLGKEFGCIDKGSTFAQIKEHASRSTGVIIATPTDTHTEIIYEILPTGKPILCEKPITKDVAELTQLFADIKASNIHFNMMFQYKNLVPEFGSGESSYDYFRHGNDGLFWDCLQIIGLAKGKVILEEKSPTWHCTINGHRLNSAHMDGAYITSVNSFLRGQPQDLDELLRIHKKTAGYALD